MTWFYALESIGRALVLDEVTFLKEGRGRMDDIGTFLNQVVVILLVVDSDSVQSGRLEHTHVSSDNGKSLRAK